MRPIANFTLHAALATVLIAFAAASAAAQSPPTFRIVTETPNRPVLELEAFRWGTTADATNLGSWSKAQGLDVTWDVAEYRGVGKVDGFTVKQQAIEKQGYAPGNTKYSGIKLSRAEPSATPGGNETMTVGSRRTESGQATGKRQHNPERLSGYYDQSGSSGAASGLPTGKRQHKPFTLTKPLDKGSVWIRVATPWTACRVGVRFPWLTLTDGTKNYRLEGASVANCGRSGAGADDRPTEEVAFYYNKIAFSHANVRGWDPKKKEAVTGQAEPR